MGEKKAIKWKNALRLLIGIIAVALWISMTFVVLLIGNYPLIAIIVLCIGGIVLCVLLTTLAEGGQKDIQTIQETDNLEKVKQILSDKYTPIKCNINYDDIPKGWQRMEAFESIVSTQADALKKFKLTLAAKLNEDKILYAIVDENGNEISQVDMHDTATFFVNNFERI